MDIIEGPITVEPVKGPVGNGFQPVEALGGLDKELDDSAVRQAILNAEQSGKDPQSLTMSELAQGQPQAPQPQAAPAAAPAKEPVPEKFLKPDGTVDVDKIQASTRQLDEAIQKKETALNKTVDDYLAEYRAREDKFRNMPNPNKFSPPPAAEAPAPAPIQTPVNVQAMPDQQLEALIRQDFQNDPLMTTTRLIELAIQKKLEPIEAEKKISRARENLQAIASKDPRILHPEVYAAINAKLDSQPDFWKLPNPYKAAWLEVKEEMRLGDPLPGQAQPSRPSAPVLAGGSPPSVPSTQVRTSQSIVSDLDRIDLRDKKQEAMADEAIRAFLARSR